MAKKRAASRTKPKPGAKPIVIKPPTGSGMGVSITRKRSPMPKKKY